MKSMRFIAHFVIIEVLAYLFDYILYHHGDATDREWFLYYNEDVLMEYRIATAQDTPHVGKSMGVLL